MTGRYEKLYFLMEPQQIVWNDELMDGNGCLCKRGGGEGGRGEGVEGWDEIALLLP